MTKYRFKCECGNLYDSAETSMACPSCKKENSTEGNGIIHIHRVSCYSGAFNALNVFIDDQPFGKLADGCGAKFVVPYGTHAYHGSMTMWKSKKLEVNVSEENPEACIKTGLDFFSFGIQAQIVDKEKMPK